eukprot:796786-Prymnesium_polylepis.1
MESVEPVLAGASASALTDSIALDSLATSDPSIISARQLLATLARLTNGEVVGLGDEVTAAIASAHSGC